MYVVLRQSTCIVIFTKLSTKIQTTLREFSAVWHEAAVLHAPPETLKKHVSVDSIVVLTGADTYF